MSFDDKVVIVTGSSSGIGAATAIEFAKQGAYIVLAAKNEIQLMNVSAQCEEVGKKPLVVKVDVTRDDEAETLINRTIEKFGKLDVLVNNAGVTAHVDILSEDFMETYDRVIGINLRAVVYITHLAIPHLKKSKGNIINISSIAGKIQLKSNAIQYCTSKAAVDHFSRCLAAKLASSSVRVNIVSPGPVRTDILKNSSIANVSWEMIGERVLLKRVSEPVEIADVILYLASEKARGITGSDFISDNGTILNW